MPTGAPARWCLQDSSSLASIGQDGGVSALGRVCARSNRSSARWRISRWPKSRDVLREVTRELVELAVARLVVDPPAVDQRAERHVRQPTHRSCLDVVQHLDRGIRQARGCFVEHVAMGIAQPPSQDRRARARAWTRDDRGSRRSHQLVPDRSSASTGPQFPSESSSDLRDLVHVGDQVGECLVGCIARELDLVLDRGREGGSPL